MMTQDPIAGQCHVIAHGVRRLTAPNPSPMTGPGTNTYIVGTDEVVVIDPGVAEHTHLNAIVRHAPGRIREIVVTHKHPDHTGGAAELGTMTGAPVRGEATPLAGVYDPGFALDGAISAGETIACGDYGLEVVHTPGHTPDHLAFLLREQGLLFAGDAVMADVTVVILPPDGDMRTYFDTLARLRQMSLQALAPGHGRVLEAPHDEIEHIIEHRRQREAQIVSLLAQGPASAAELVARIYPQISVALQPMARAQLSAHLLKLEHAGTVQQDQARWYLPR